MTTRNEIIAAEVVKMEIIKKIGAENELGANVRTKKLFFGAFISLKLRNQMHFSKALACI